MNTDRLDWTIEISVCNDKLDMQHQRLFEIINELGEEKARTDPEEYARLLSRLTDYFQIHFACEEKYMTEFGYPDIKKHHTEHLKYTRDLAMFNHEFKRQVPTGASALSKYMKEWFIIHILGSDMDYKKFIADREVVTEAKITTG